MEKKDHYTTLGVLPSAEDCVVQAACLALVNRYRRKGWTHDPATAHERLAAINEAHEVLRNPERRMAYDATYTAGPDCDLENEKSESVFDAALADRASNWQRATEVFPDLRPVRLSLRRKSPSLEFACVVLLLEKKCFKDHLKIAAQLEREFDATYLRQAGSA